MQYLRVPVLALAVFSIAHAQAGHWEGKLHSNVRASDIIVDLAQNAKGEWIGTVGFPDQNTKGIPLANISVKESKVKFTVTRLPGNQSFEGHAWTDGKSMSGGYKFNGKEMICNLERKGEAVFEPPAKNPPLARDLEGDWEGTLLATGRKLRMKLHLANGPDGATGTVVSVDQGGGDIPISTVTQSGSDLKLDLPMISVVFIGELSADRKQIAGKWTQGTHTMPLTFKRPAPATAKP